MNNSSSRASRRSNLKSALIVALKAAEAGVDGIPIPGVKGCISGIRQIIEQEELRDANLATFRGLVDKITQLKEATEGRLTGEENIPEDLKGDVEKLAKNLNGITEQYTERIADRSKMRARIKGFFSAKDDSEALNELGESVKTAIDVFHTASLTSLRMAEQKREADRRRDEERRILEEQRHIQEEQNREANRLMDVFKKAIEPKAYFNAHRERPIEVCQPGTRVSLLQDVAKWAEDTSSDHPRILWLNGRAGVGKSTIAKTVATRFNDAKVLGGSFMFSKPNGVTDGCKVCTTLAYQLAHHLSDFRHYLVAAIRDSESSIEAEISQQFKDLLAAPLSELSDSVPPPAITVIVIDALDECSAETLKPMLTSVAELVLRFPFLRIVVTSRPHHPIDQVLHLQCFMGLISEKDLSAISVSDDIARYLRMRLSDAYSHIMGEPPSTQTWPADTDLVSLVKMAGNLFVFAATAVRFIGDERAAEPQRRLELILCGQVADQSRALRGIDIMYREILQNALGSGDDNLCDRFQAVVGTIVFSMYPHSVDSLAEILSPKHSANDIRNSLKYLHSVLVVPAADDTAGLQVYHKSFADFITNSGRCTLTEAFLHPSTHHIRLCLRHLEMAESQFDTLSAIAATANEGNVWPIAYSILKWEYHFCALEDLVKGDNTKVEETVLSTSQRAYLLIKLTGTCRRVIIGRNGVARAAMALDIIESKLITIRERRYPLHNKVKKVVP